MFTAIASILGMACVFVAGGVAARWYYGQGRAIGDSHSTVMMEKIKKVAKLVTVEGYFSEIYDHKDYKWYDFGFLRKKALIRIKAKVSVGFDLTKMKIETNGVTKTIYLSELPKPEILSIEDKLDYYDISEGTFNSFKPEDYNALNERAREYIRETAKQSEVMLLAHEHGDKVLDIIKAVAEGSGWKVVRKDLGVGGVKVLNAKNEE
jgi:hypothetical protein